jgi:hypothetical protein
MMVGYQRHWLNSDRSLTCDVVYFARRLPIARAEMSIDLAELAACRAAALPRVSWTALFLKAYGQVTDASESLRQSFMRWPLSHVYQHERSVAMLAMEREHEGRPRLCWGRIINPGRRSLRNIQQQLNQYADKPVTEAFRKQIRLSRWPWPLRRLAWWIALNGSGRVRERQIGTFSLSSLAGQGVNNRDHPTICTSSLTYGPLDRDGHSLVTLVYDHRLLDGMQAARALQRLRSHLQEDIVAELRRLSANRLAA